MPRALPAAQMGVHRPWDRGFMEKLGILHRRGLVAAAASPQGWHRHQWPQLSPLCTRPRSHPWEKAARGHEPARQEVGAGIREVGMPVGALGEAQTDVDCPSQGKARLEKLSQRCCAGETIRISIWNGKIPAGMGAGGLGGGSQG